MIYLKVIILLIVVILVMYNIDVRRWRSVYFCKVCKKEVQTYHITHCPYCGELYPFQIQRITKLVGWFKNTHYIYGDEK